MYSNIYRLTIDWFPGFLFLFITLIQAIICVAMIWVHVQAVREGVFITPEPPRDIQRVNPPILRCALFRFVLQF